MSKRLFVGNLPYQVDDAALLDAFQSQGHKVANCRVVLDRDTGRSRGFAFVDIDDDAAALAAIESMNNYELFGRPIRVTEAEDRRPPRPGGPGAGPRPGGGGGGPPRSDGPRGDGPRGPRPDSGARFGTGKPMRKRGAGDDDYRRGDRDGARRRREREDEDGSRRRGFDPDGEDW